MSGTYYDEYIGDFVWCGASVTNSGDPFVLEAATGIDYLGRGPNEVTWLAMHGENLAHFLKDINVFFPGLKTITWERTPLQSLKADDLKQFPNLVYLRITGNRLVALDGDIFMHNPRLQYIDFRGNQLTSVGANILDGLLDLKFANFRDNNCIDYFANTTENIAILKKDLTAQCPSSLAPPTLPPTVAPTEPATEVPTLPPTVAPTVPSTIATTEVPTFPPSVASTLPPTTAPTLPPTIASTLPRTIAPTLPTSVATTLLPTIAPTEPATKVPTLPPSTSTTTTDGTKTFSPCRRQCNKETGGGTVPSRTNCKRYYECRAGMQYPKTCSGSLMFDAHSGVCLDTGSAICVNNLVC